MFVVGVAATTVAVVEAEEDGLVGVATGCGGFGATGVAEGSDVEVVVVLVVEETGVEEVVGVFDELVLPFWGAGSTAGWFGGVGLVMIGGLAAAFC